MTPTEKTVTPTEKTVEKTTVPVQTPARMFQPFMAMEPLFEEMTKFLTGVAPFGPFPKAFKTEATWLPKLDIHEEEGMVVVNVDLPGVKVDDIELTLEDGTLIVKGQRTFEQTEQKPTFYRVERSFGTFYRALPLPFEVMPDQIQAAFTNGVLTVKIPKVAKLPPQKIPIS